MIRRSTLLPLALAATVALSGCATFETDVVASVGDVDLRQEEFEEIAAGRGLITDDGRVEGEIARGIVTEWILRELFKADVGTLGLPEPDVDENASIGEQAQLFQAAWLGATADDLGDDRLEAAYTGLDSSLVCLWIIADSDPAVTQDLSDAVADGSVQIAELASIPSGNSRGAVAEQLGCGPLERVDAALPPAIASATRSADVGVPSEPFELDGGFAAIWRPRFDELSAEEMRFLRVQTWDDRYDISVASHIGRWDRAGAVVQVG